MARCALLHRDVPGVLARVGEHGLDVDGQVPAGRGKPGYAVTDVGAAGS